MLEIDVDLCTSRDRAIKKLLATPYNLIISGVYLAELDDFMLVKQCQAHQSSVPLVVTAKASDTDSARQALMQGAFDVMANPLVIDQSGATIQLALWQSKLHDLIAKKERAVSQFRQHLANYPSQMQGDEVFQRSVAVMRTPCPPTKGPWPGVRRVSSVLPIWPRCTEAD
jgi:DNA-binding NtrC family response regulator